jgi:23S rRNA (guanine2445-N2)-methyltransferase / 23S rRNA (guanine2069-N7)-methyltransferase
MVTNPPYGDRLGQAGPLGGLYEALGDVLKQHFGGWTAAILAGNTALTKSIGLRPDARHPLYNGPIECELLSYAIRASQASSPSPGWRKPSPESEMFANRLRKNHRKLAKWARKNEVDCYRIYDADIPEYNVVIDVYGSSVHIQEYTPPHSIKPHIANQRLRDVRLIVTDLLQVEPGEVFVKVRERSEGGTQYGRLSELEEIRQVQERDLTFEVNLSDYLDTGVFLDHRKLREHIQRSASGARFLNLFAYTCTATVAAAKGGAVSSWSVDLSRNYLAWGRRNLDLNQVGPREHRVWRGDWLEFLQKHRELEFDLAYLGPPTYSTSKSAPTFDLQWDHPRLLQEVLERMAPGGVVYFGAPTRQFSLNASAIRGARIENISSDFLPHDFKRSQANFHLWRLTRNGEVTPAPDASDRH